MGDTDSYTHGYLDAIEATRPLIDRLRQQVAELEKTRDHLTRSIVELVTSQEQST